ncbi:uncharacterized protein LOC142095229 isoform X2 [Mixophyes fleayi]|uniref:uncharacterized protein LOC142095229 isoform X2 n=1 Tax=Mixophyes fleayi TaxID=3061075 RepID=UPI003F4E237B
MPKCIFRTCPHCTGKKCFYPGITLHVFPRELSRIKLWLQQTGQYYGNIDAFAEKILESSKMGSYRMCSAHFDSDCYTSQGTKVVLRPDAIPTIFPGNVTPVAMDWKHLPQQKKPRPEQGDAVKSPRRSRSDASTSTVHILQTEVGTQTELSLATIRARSVKLPYWLTSDKGVQWPEYEFNFYGEYWKVQRDHMYYNSKLKCAQEISIPTDDQEECMKDGLQVPSKAQKDVPARWDCDVAAQKTIKEESHISSQTPEGYFLSDCTMRNRKTLCNLQAKLVALLRHMIKAPHMGSYKRQRTRRLLHQVVEIVCLLAGEDLKLVKKNEDLSKYYQKEGEIPVRYEDVAVFFTREEWNYIEGNEDLYKKEMLSDPNEPKESQADNSADVFKEDTDITDDHFFNLLSVNMRYSQGHSRRAASQGKKLGKGLPLKVEYFSDGINEREGNEDSDWDTAATHDLEFLSDNERERRGDEDDNFDKATDLDMSCLSDVGYEETVRENQDSDSPVHMETDSSTDAGMRWDTMGEPPDPPGSTLWIAPDGTTSTQWIPQYGSTSTGPFLKKPRSRKKKPKDPELLNKSVSASQTTDTDRIPLDDPTDQEEVVKNSEDTTRDSTALGPVDGQSPQLEETLWCDICNKSFRNETELETHQTTHLEEMSLECEECGEAFDSGPELEKHKIKKHGKMRYPCEICGLQYNYRSQYIIHQRAHTGEKPFRCHECGQAFGHKSSLVIHQRKHSGSTPYNCDKCGKMFDTEEALEKHSKLRFCAKCKKCFTRRALRRHMQTHT